MIFKKILSPVALVCAAVMMLASCSKSVSVNDKAKEYLPDDCVLMMSGDIERVLNALECKTNSDGQIELSDDLAALASGAHGIDEFLDFKGVNWDNVVVGSRIKGDNVTTMILFSVLDKDAFCKSAQDSDENFEVEEEDGYTIVGEKSAAIAIKDNVGIIVVKDSGRPAKRNKVVSTIEDWRAEAKENTMADWKIDYLAESRVFNMLMNCKKISNMYPGADALYGINPVIKDIMKGYIGLSFDVDGLQAVAKGEAFDAEGKPLKLDAYGAFDSSLLAYASPKDVFAAGMGVGSTKDSAQSLSSIIPYMNEQMFAQIQQVYDMFDNSSVMFAAGPTGGLQSIVDPQIENWHMVLAAKMAPGKAEEAMNLLRTMSPDSTVAANPNEMTFRIVTGYKETEPDYGEYDDMYGGFEEVYATVYVKREGDVVIVSNAPIAKQSNSFKAGEFEGKAVEAQLTLSKADLKRITGMELPFGVNAVVDMAKDSNGGSFAIALTETTGTIVGNILEVTGGLK